MKGLLLSGAAATAALVQSFSQTLQAFLQAEHKVGLVL
jgi:hypothetical protein